MTVSTKHYFRVERDDLIIISRKYTVAYLLVLRYVLLVNELRLSGLVSVFIHGAFSTKKSKQKP
jgi:hypothetical protein